MCFRATFFISILTCVLSSANEEPNQIPVVTMNGETVGYATVGEKFTTLKQRHLPKGHYKNSFYIGIAELKGEDDEIPFCERITMVTSPLYLEKIKPRRSDRNLLSTLCLEVQGL